MNTTRWSAIALGVACGFLSAYTLLATSWWSLVLWGVAGVALGFFVAGLTEILWCGGLYGFFLSISFLLPIFHGTSDKRLAFALLTLALCVIGIAGGIIAVAVGSWIRNYTRPLW